MTTSMRFESSEASMPSHLVGFSLAFTPVFRQRVGEIHFETGQLAVSPKLNGG